MSRNSLIRPRRPRAVSDRPAPATRLLPTPYPLTLPPNPYYQRYVEAERLRLGSDHPLFLSQYCLTPVSDDGRFLDSTRQALLQGNHCRDNAPRTGRVYVAGIDLAGESEQPAIGGIRAIEPSRDSTVVTIGELRSLDDGLGSKLPSISVVEHYWWTGKPHTEIFSTLVHILKNVWGCRRIVVDATGVGAGVAAFLRKSPGPSIPSPSAPSPVGTTGWSPWGGTPSLATHERDRLLAHTHIISHAHPLPRHPSPSDGEKKFPPKQSNGRGFNQKRSETIKGPLSDLPVTHVPGSGAEVYQTPCAIILKPQFTSNTGALPPSSSQGGVRVQLSFSRLPIAR